jgi:hypothetical protein
MGIRFIDQALSAICCLMSAVCNLLSAICCLQSAVSCLLSVVCYLICCVLRVVCCLLSTCGSIMTILRPYQALSGGRIGPGPGAHDPYKHNLDTGPAYTMAGKRRVRRDKLQISVVKHSVSAGHLLN